MNENDPLAWRGASAPTLAQFEMMAIEAFRRLPDKFRLLCADLVIKIDDFATDEVLDHLGAQSEFDVLGLFQGVGLPFRSESAPTHMPNMMSVLVRSKSRVRTFAAVIARSRSRFTVIFS